MAQIDKKTLVEHLMEKYEPTWRFDDILHAINAIPTSDTVAQNCIIKIRDTQKNVLAFVSVENGKINEQECQSCYLSDVDEANGKLIYRIDLERNVVLENISLAELLKELERRLLVH